MIWKEVTEAFEREVADKFRATGLGISELLMLGYVCGSTPTRDNEPFAALLGRELTEEEWLALENLFEEQSSNVENIIGRPPEEAPPATA
jgi:hypothetical protein